MSSLLWTRDMKYYYSDKPCTGDLLEQSISMNLLGHRSTIVNALNAHGYAQAFNRANLVKEPAKWGAYIAFMNRYGSNINLTPEEVLLADLVESVDPNIWVQNREFVSMILKMLIKHSINIR